jgi:predicted TIM-barrel fold metal-dependent hydrolase
MPIIDAHSHFEDTSPTPKMLEEFSKNGVVGAVVHAHRTRKAPVIPKRGPVAFAVCAAVVPGASVDAIARDVEAGRYQCLKIYLGYVSKRPSDPFYQPFYALADSRHLPVVFHTGDTYDKGAEVKYADPLGVDEVAVAFPRVTFVIAHLGNPWIQSAAEVIYKNDNVYGDLSALMLGDVGKKEDEALQELLIKPIHWAYLYVENPKKLLFGTDWPLVDIRSYIDAVKRAIPEKSWEDVFYRNALRVFKSLGTKLH